MNRDITSIYKAYARSNRLHPILLISATFDNATLRFWNGYQTLSFGGVDYTGAGDLLNISSSAETEELKANGITVGLSGISSEIISTALNQSVAGRPINIKMGFLSGDPQEILEYKVTVSGGKYYIEQELTPKLYVIRGQTYRFNQSDSTNATHNLRVSQTSDGTHGGGTQYTDGWSEVRVEHVTNGNFDTNTNGWTTSSGASASVTSGIVTVTANQYHTFSQDLTLVGGETYFINLVTTEENGSWFVAMHNGSSVFAYVNIAVGSQTLQFTADSTANQIRFYPYTTGSSTLKIDSVSVVGDVTAVGSYNQWVVPKLSSATTNYDVTVVSNGQLYNNTGYDSSNYGNVFQLNKLRTQDIDSGKTVNFTNAQGDITGNDATVGTGSTQRNTVSLFKGTITLSSSYSSASLIWEMGGTAVGAWFGISKQNNAYFLRLRGGHGTVDLNTATTTLSIAQVAVSTLSHFFDGNEHEVAWELDPPNGRSAIWIDGTLVALGFTTDGSSMQSNQYAGGDGGGYISTTSVHTAGGVTDSGGNQFQSRTTYTGGATGSLSHYNNQYANQAIVPIELQEGQTYRFTQSDSSNDGHPLFISTSNSATLSQVQSGYVDEGVTYYIDGTKTFSQYTDTTTFNAGTTRYLEFTPTSSGTFYIACYVHGIGMGFPLNVNDTSTFYYYCQNHSGMGGEINVSNDFVLFEPFTLFDGQMDKMNIQDSGDTANVTITCESKLITLQNPKVRRYTLEDQKLDFPNDKGLEFIPSLQDKVITWGRG